MAEKLTLRPMQEVFVQRALAEPTGGVLDGSDMGAGKTATSAEIALRLGLPRVLIVAPRNTLKQWAAVFAAQSDGAVVVRRMDSTERGMEAFEDFMAGKPGYFSATVQWLVTRDFAYSPAVDADGEPIWKMKKSTGELILKDGEPIQETLRTHLKTFYRKVHVDVTIFDECFVAGKMVDTPNGPRAIETLRPGDVVWGYDHSSGALKRATVMNIMKRQSADILPTGATANHPYWVEGSGYRPAADIVEGDMLLERSGSDVRVVPAGVRAVSGESETEILLPAMFGDMAHADGRLGGTPGGTQGVARVGRGQGGTVSADDGSGAQGQGGFVGAHASEQSGLDAWRQGEDRGDESAEPPGLLVPDGREWTSGRSGAGALLSAWWRLGDAVLGRDRQGREGAGVSPELQDRSGAAAGEARGGVRWGEPQESTRAGARPAKDSLPGIEGVDHLAILEPRDPDRYQRVRQAHRRSAPVDVYNIETDTSNYFVDSILVHNCHAIQSRNALATRTMRTIASDRRIGLSGTWHGNNFSGAYAPVDWVWPGLLSPSYYSWLDEWAEVKMQCPKCFADVESDDEQCGRCYLTFTRKKRPISSVVGEKNPGAFVKSLPCYFRAEPFPQPPPALEVVVDITPDQRAQYEDLEAQAVTWVRDHDGIEVPIVADLPIVQRQRLRTAALGELALDGEGEIFFADDCKSAKLVALRGVLDEFDRAAGRKEKAVIFTDSKRFARVTARRMQAAGYRTVLWTGDVGETARERLKADFVEDRADYIVASIASLSEGVDGLQRVCSKVVWLSRSENALLNQQSLRRIWRIGVDQAAFAQVDIIARRTLDDGTLRRLEATQTRNRAQMGLTA